MKKSGLLNDHEKGIPHFMYTYPATEFIILEETSLKLLNSPLALLTTLPISWALFTLNPPTGVPSRKK